MEKTGNNNKASCIAVLGTGSDVGKSIVATALCRVFADMGLRVAPYKSQNMSNNSGVTPEGLEMGRAQIVQAEAAGIAPHVDMNPILLKPTSDVGSQVVLLGEALTNSTAMEYHRKKEHLFKSACDALDRLRGQYDLVIMEGAGSCAEVNLMEHDIVNFSMAKYADAPVILTGDIHRGGIFGQLVGTLACLPDHYKQMIKGFVINRFKGDIRLFEDGVQWIENQTKKSVFGVLPWYTHITIEPEDSVVIEKPKNKPLSGKKPAVAVIRLPHISNFTDFDPLSKLDGLELHFVEKPVDLCGFTAVIIPGSKNTRYDLKWLKTSGWSPKLEQYDKNLGHILGICGGYQMMGTRVHDPHGLEGNPGSTNGLGLLPVETTLKAPKTTTRTHFLWDDIKGAGYEIHMGRTVRSGGRALLQVVQRNREKQAEPEGCVTKDMRKIGTYMHGLFETPAIISKWFDTIGLKGISIPQTSGLKAKETEYGLLAKHFINHMDMDKIKELAGI